VAAVDIRPVRGGDQRHGGHPGHRHQRDDHARGRELAGAPQYRTGPGQQIGQAQCGQHHPGLDLLGLESQPHPQAGQDEPAQRSAGRRPIGVVGREGGVLARVASGQPRDSP
jgi:hypothetical protein